MSASSPRATPPASSSGGPAWPSAWPSGARPRTSKVSWPPPLRPTPTSSGATAPTAGGYLLGRLAEHDWLPGLLTRRMCESHPARPAAAAGGGRPGALLSLDLARFKAVNDTVGHLAADRFLIGLTRRLHENTRDE